MFFITLPAPISVFAHDCIPLTSPMSNTKKKDSQILVGRIVNMNAGTYLKMIWQFVFTIFKILIRLRTATLLLRIYPKNC